MILPVVSVLVCNHQRKVQEKKQEPCLSEHSNKFIFTEKKKGVMQNQRGFVLATKPKNGFEVCNEFETLF